MCTSHFHKHPCSHVTPCLSANVVSHCPKVLALLHFYHDQPNHLPLVYPLPMPKVCPPSPQPNLSQQMGGQVDGNSQAVGEGNMRVLLVPWGCGREDNQLCRVGWGDFTCPWVSAKVAREGHGGEPRGPDGPDGPHGSQGPHGPHGPHGPYGPYGSHGPHGPHGGCGPHQAYGTHISFGSNGMHGYLPPNGPHEAYETYGPQGAYGGVPTDTRAMTCPGLPTGPVARTGLESTASVAGEVKDTTAAKEDKETKKPCEVNKLGEDTKADKGVPTATETTKKSSNNPISSSSFSEKKENKDEKKHADGHIDGTAKKPQGQHQQPPENTQADDFKNSKNRKRTRNRRGNGEQGAADHEPEASQAQGRGHGQGARNRKAQRQAKAQAILNHLQSNSSSEPKSTTTAKKSAKTIAKERAAALATDQRAKRRIEATTKKRRGMLEREMETQVVYAGYVFQGETCLRV